MAKRSHTVIRQAAEQAVKAFKEAKPGKSLGDIAFWDFTPGYREDCAVVQEAWSMQGLQPDADLPAPIDIETAFSRAVRAAAIGAGSKDCRIEACALQADNARRVAVLKLERNGVVKGDTIGLVALPPGESPRIELADAYGIADEIKNNVSKYALRYTTDDLRTGVLTILERWAATPCRQVQPHIVYWMPPPGGPELRKVRDVLKYLGAGDIHLIPMGTDSESHEAAATAANGGLEASLSALLAEADAWVASPPGRASTIENRLNQADKIRQTASLYKSILGSSVAAIEDRIKQVEDSLRKMLGIVKPAPSANP
jgi:hypothetical protein